jgi:hypothetical protein
VVVEDTEYTDIGVVAPVKLPGPALAVSSAAGGRGALPAIPPSSGGGGRGALPAVPSGAAASRPAASAASSTQLVGGKKVKVSPSAPFWRPRMSRVDAIELLQAGNPEGAFIIRDSSEPAAVALSMFAAGKVRHYKLTETPAGYALEKDTLYPPCRTLEDVVTHLQRTGEGLKCRLTVPGC